MGRIGTQEAVGSAEDERHDRRLSANRTGARLGTTATAGLSADHDVSLIATRQSDLYAGSTRARRRGVEAHAARQAEAERWNTLRTGIGRSRLGVGGREATEQNRGHESREAEPADVRRNDRANERHFVLLDERPAERDNICRLVLLALRLGAECAIACAANWRLSDPLRCSPSSLIACESRA